MTEQIRYVSLDAAVYVDTDGSVAFLDSPNGFIPPPFIGNLTYFGGQRARFFERASVRTRHIERAAARADGLSHGKPRELRDKLAMRMQGAK